MGVTTPIFYPFIYLTTIVTIALSVDWLYRLRAMEELTRMEENKNVSLTELLTNSMGSVFSPLMTPPTGRTDGGVVETGANRAFECCLCISAQRSHGAKGENLQAIGHNCFLHRLRPDWLG